MELLPCLRFHNTQILFPKRMRRSHDSSIMMYRHNKNLRRQSPQLQKLQFHTFRHNHQHMTAIDRVILYPFQYYKIRVSLSFNGISPFPISIIRIVIGYQHPTESLFLQAPDIFFNHYLAIHRAFFCVAMHIEFHILTSLSFYSFFAVERIVIHTYSTVCYSYIHYTLFPQELQILFTLYRYFLSAVLWNPPHVLPGWCAQQEIFVLPAGKEPVPRFFLFPLFHSTL